MHPADGHGRALRRRGVLDDPAQLRAVVRQTVAERIRTHVAARSIAIGAGIDVAVTVSIGGAFAPQWVRSSALLWVERADQQLYRAKSEGRNRACLERPTVSLVSPEEKGLLFGTSQFAEL
jgi:predicted signal transduction protein with EAL and GGDEF domain